MKPSRRAFATTSAAAALAAGMPAGSNWSSDVNFKGTVGFCKKNFAPEHLKGFLMAPWFFTLKEWQEKNLQAIAQVEEMIATHGRH